MNKPFLTTLAAATSLLSHAHSQTDFTNADAADSFITTAGNWENGLPIGQQGTITLNAAYNATNVGGTGPDKDDPLFPVNGYDILHTAGTLSRGSGISAFRIGGGTTYVMNGATAAFSGTRGIGVSGAGTTFTLIDGNANFTDNSRDSTVTNAGAIIVNGGTMSHGRHLYLQSGNVTVNGGALTVPGDLGARNFHIGGDLSLNGGATSAQYLTFGTAATNLNFGGTTAGSLVIQNFGGSRANVNHIDIDFDPGSQMTMQLTAPVEQGATGDGDLGWTDAADPATGLEWAQALWETGRLSYNNRTVSGIDILGEGGTTVLTWAQAQVDLGDGSHFLFDSPSHTLSLVSGGGGGDTSPPTWTATYPQVTDVTETGATARASIHEDGTAYFVVVPDGATAPSSAQVKAGTDASDSPAMDSGSLVLTADTELSEAITGLSATTSYDVYFVAEDDEGTPNLQAAPVLVEFSTSGGGTPYATWAAGGELFGNDENGDGVPNGLAFLLGAAHPDADATGLLPTVTVDETGNMTMTFRMLNAAKRGSAGLSTQHSSDLGVADLWNALHNQSLVPEGPGTGIVVGVVSFDVSANGDFNDIQATIPAGESNGSGKLFGRLSASE